MPAATDGLPCWRVSGCVTLILVISCHAIVTGFGEREGEAREKLGASKCGRQHQGLVGFALMIRDVALSIGKTRRDSEDNACPRLQCKS
jgi:hypothetical protein